MGGECCFDQRSQLTAHAFLPRSAALEFSCGFKPISIYANYVQQSATGGAGGSFNPGLQGLERFPAILSPAGGGWFSPDHCFPLLSAQVGV